MTLQEAYRSQNQVKEHRQEKNIIVNVPELTHLVKHLDFLYSELLKKKEDKQQEGQPMVEILGKPYIQTRSWFNPGQGIKQSAAVQ